MGQYSYLYNALRKTAALNKRAEYLEKLHNYFMMQKTAAPNMFARAKAAMQQAVAQAKSDPLAVREWEQTNALNNTRAAKANKANAEAWDNSFLNRLAEAGGNLVDKAKGAVSATGNAIRNGYNAAEDYIDDVATGTNAYIDEGVDAAKRGGKKLGLALRSLGNKIKGAGISAVDAGLGAAEEVGHWGNALKGAIGGAVDRAAQAYDQSKNTYK